MEDFKISFISLYIFEVIMGVLLLVFTDNVLNYMALGMGILIFVFGVIKCASSIRKMKKTNNYVMDRMELVLGFILMFGGIFMMIMQKQIIDILPIMFGIYIILASFFSLRSAYKLKKYESDSWIGILVVTVFLIFAGLFIALKSDTITKYVAQVIGIIFIVRGVTDIVSTLALQLAYKKAAVDTTYREVDDDEEADVTVDSETTTENSTTDSENKENP